ncbi:uncharacterized protein LOC117318361 [Pecten maximus]|uniref:uncharacterized protein LOC117318361 n=1 Tax=Pecten maximus TaxID=6579 RepID=UPI0014582305|nr:uncharacterized protein LOC117318361 [Pecten maximus]
MVKQTKAQSLILDKYFKPCDSTKTLILDELTDDYFEYEQGEREIIVKGRLKSSIEFWKSFCRNQFVLDVIQYGYKIPFFSSPPKMYLPNNKSALSNADFVKEAITQLVRKGLVERCEDVPLVVNPLTVSTQSNGKKRLILDLRCVNAHLWKEKVKFDDIRTALIYLNQGSWMYKFDIHSAYHHIDIFADHTKYLGFSWVFDGKVEYFKFLVLPFGIRTAPYLFTKITRPLIGKWRGEGYQILMYLDDGLGVNLDKELCRIQSEQVKSDLLQSGFVPKAEKSLWSPTQSLVFLGVDVNAEEGRMSIPEQRILRAQSCIDDVIRLTERGCSVHVKKLAKCIGHVISMSIVFGSVTQLMTRSMSMQVASTESWNEHLSLSDMSLEQARFWSKNIRIRNSTVLRFEPQCHRIVFSDASNTGYGGYCVESSMGVAQGLWSKSDASKSSTWRELTAVSHVLSSLVHVLQGQRVKWFSDNQGVIGIVDKGSMKAELQDIAMHIYEKCCRFNIRLEMEWVPRAENEKADYLSRINDPDDWEISNSVYKQLDRLWGPFDIDWFASYYNAKHSVFYSLFWNPGSAGMDAFTANWAGFLRSAEVLALMRCDIKVSSTHMEIFIEKSKTDIYRDGACFGLHSFRAGGASAAANHGIPDRLFKKHGRWRSETAKDGYVKDDENHTLINCYTPAWNIFLYKMIVQVRNKCPDLKQGSKVGLFRSCSKSLSAKCRYLKIWLTRSLAMVLENRGVSKYASVAQ